MFTAYITDSSNECRKVSDIREAVAAWRDEKAVIWADVEGLDGDLDQMAEGLGLTPDSIEDCRSGEQRPRVDEYPHYLFLLLYGAVGMNGSSAWAPRKIGIFYGERFLITVHEEPVRIISELHERCAKTGMQPLQRGLDFHFYAVVDGLVDNYMICAEAFEDVLDALEEESLQEAPDQDLPERLSEYRWELIEFRRHLGSMRELLMAFTRGTYEQLSDELENRFLHVQDHATMAFERVEGLREIMQAIRDNYHVQIEERTNALMRVLTIFATMMLPLTIITGIYGMNIVLWPPPDQPLTTLFVFGAMFVVAGVLFGFFRWRRWL